MFQAFNRLSFQENADDAVKCYVFVGCVMAINSLTVLLLVETKGKSLADTLHQDQKELDTLNEC